MTSALLMDIKETPGSYEVHCDIPGVDKDNLKITVSPSQQEIQITAFKQGLKQEAGDDYKMVERVTGQLTRTLYLPKDANSDELKARFKSGVLELTIPKLSKDEQKEQSRTVAIEF